MNKPLVFALVISAATVQILSAQTPKIAWYGTLSAGLDEAKRSNRPIFLVSAAPQCQNVAGMW